MGVWFLPLSVALSITVLHLTLIGPWTKLTERVFPDTVSNIYFMNSLISWSTVKQKTISLSSTEAKYYSMTHAIKEALWTCLFLSLHSFPITCPFPLLSDNQSACALTNNSSITLHSKHINIHHHFICGLIANGSFCMNWIPTSDIPADIFMKLLVSYHNLFSCDTIPLLVLSLFDSVIFSPDGGELGYQKLISHDHMCTHVIIRVLYIRLFIFVAPQLSTINFLNPDTEVWCKFTLLFSFFILYLIHIHLDFLNVTR